MRSKLGVMHWLAAVFALLIAGCAGGVPDRDWDNMDYIAEVLQPDLDKLAKHRWLSDKEAKQAAQCEADVLLKSNMSDDGVDLFAMGYTSIPGGLLLGVNDLSNDDFAAFQEVAGDFAGCLHEPQPEPKNCDDRCADPLLPSLKRSLNISWNGPEWSSATNTDLVGLWRVVDLYGPDGKSVMATPSKGVWIEFESDGTYGATTECNGVSGDYRQDRADFWLRNTAMSLVGCRETPLWEELWNVRHVSGRGDKRTLHSDKVGGNVVAELERYRPGMRGVQPPKGFL